MPVWDFVCTGCKAQVELAFRSAEEADDAVCNTCGCTLTRQPASGSFTIKGYNAKNGYTK